MTIEEKPNGVTTFEDQCTREVLEILSNLAKYLSTSTSTHKIVLKYHCT